MHMTGKQIITAMLERHGVTCLAGIPGGANLPLYDALGASARIRHILVRHEQAAGFIAQGWARVTGEAGVCMATSGPGATNLITAVADAKLDSIPLVAITGQVPTSMIGTDAFQEVDTYGMTMSITKHNFLVRSAGELLDVMPDAFRIATSGRPGPVLIDVPKDVQNQSVEFDALPEPARPDPSPEADPEDLARAVQMINQAQRPILYIGGGVIASGASGSLRRLARKTGIPVTSTLMGLGAVPVDDRHYIGMLGMHGARHTNLAIEECDVLIAAGVRFDDRATGRVQQFCPHAKILHIDIDRSELHKIKAAHLAITGDIGAVLEALEPRLDATDRQAWNKRIAELKQMYPLEMPGLEDPFMPYGLIRQVANLLDDDTPVVTDVGQHQMWVAQAYPFRRPRRWLTSGGLGTMGFGLPTAIGATLARPETPAVLFTGDGSLLMNLQELATAAEEGLNVKVIVMNNESLGLVRQQQDLFYGQRCFAVQYRLRHDFCTVARGLGVQAIDLAEENDPMEAMARAFTQPGPALINVPIEQTEDVYPMVPPGAPNKEMIGGQRHACVR